MLKNLFIKYFTLGILFISTTFSFSQIFIHRTKEENLTFLKNSTLYFVCPQSMIDEKDSIEILLDEAWNYCNIKVISYNEMKKYYGKNNVSFFSISRNLSSGAPIQYVLWIAKDPSEYEIESYPFEAAIARLHLNGNCQIDSLITSNELTLYKKKDQIMEFIYNSEIENMKPGILCNNLKMIEQALENNTKNPKGSPSNPDTKGLKSLTDETLYITDNVRYQFFNSGYRLSKLCVNREINVNKLMEDYPYPYQLITFDELNSKLLNGDKFIYLLNLDYSASNRNWFIFNTDGDCLYSEMLYDPFCKPKDFKKIAKLIGK